LSQLQISEEAASEKPSGLALEIEPPPDFVRIRIADASLSVIETNSMDR
jgi:hypothetical protein